jgi:hypothetical protein
MTRLVALAIALLLLLPPALKAAPREGVIGADDRQVLTKFDPSPAISAKTLRKRLGATHRMVCEDQAASANLVLTNDTVVTVAHLLVRPDGSRRDIAKCAFVVDRNGRTTRYPVRVETLRIGKFRGADKRVFGLLDIVNDWMVIRLARPVPGITPYLLPVEADGAFFAGKPVTTVSALTDNWPSKRETLRLAERCTLRNQFGGARERHAVMVMDCDVGYGSSGGAILVGISTPRPRLLGLMTDFKEEGDCIAYDPSNCFSAGIAMRASVIEAIRSVGDIRVAARKQRRKPRR